MHNIHRSRLARCCNLSVGILTAIAIILGGYPITLAVASPAPADPLSNIDHFIIVYQENWSFDALYGNFPGANGLANASSGSLNQIDRLSGSALSSLPPTNGFNRYTGSGTENSANTNTNPGFLNIPPQPLNGAVDTRFNTNSSDATSPLKVNTLRPFDLTAVAGISPNDKTGDIVHRYWQEQFQIAGAFTSGGSDFNTWNNEGFATWSDNPGLVLSGFDATNLPEGLLAQHYTMCDNFFHSAFGGSFLNHQFLIAAQAPVYYNMSALNNGAIAYLDTTGLLKLNSTGNDSSGNPAVGKVIRDGSVTPVAGDLLSGLRIDGVPNQSATVTSSGTPSDVAFNSSSHFDKHYVVNTSFSRNLATNTTTFATAGTGDVTNGSSTVSNAAGARLGSNNVGMTVSGAGIPTGAVVTAVNTTSHTITLSQPATATAAAVALSFSGYPVSLIPSQDNSSTMLNIGDLLDARGISWKWYSGGWNDALDSSPSNPLHFGSSGPNTVNSLFQWHHQAFAFFEKSKPFDSTKSDGRNPYATAHLQDEANLYTDIANNSLPSVAFVKFLGPDNEHPGYASLQQGQQHVADLVAAVQANPAVWARTAIIITYDEHGGRWDHVTPNLRDIWGPGVRVPAIVISPYSKREVVNHANYDTSSILSTIEHRFGLSSLNQRDTKAPTLAASFAPCTIPDTSIGATAWNKFNVSSESGGVVWVHAHLSGISGIPTNQISKVVFSGVSFVLNGMKYPIPDGVVTFDPSASDTSTTTYNSLLNQWQTTINPNKISDEDFFTGAAIPVDPNIMGGGTATIQFTTSSDDVTPISYPWQWSAAAYTWWPSDWNQALIQAYHGNGPAGSQHAGAPDNKQVQKSLIQGPRGGAGSNYTGSWSASGQSDKCQ